MNIKIGHGIIGSIIVNAVLEIIKEHLQSFDACVYFVKYFFRKHFLMVWVFFCTLLTETKNYYVSAKGLDMFN